MIRVAGERDLPEIVRIYNEAVEDQFATADLHPVTAATRRAWFEDHDPGTFPIYVVEHAGAVRGWCSLSRYRAGRAALAGTAEISYYVQRDARGQGLGSALVQHAVREAPRLGKRVLFAILLERNAASIGLLRKCGFEPWGRLPDVAEIEGQLVAHVYYGRRLG